MAVKKTAEPVEVDVVEAEVVADMVVSSERDVDCLRRTGSGFASVALSER